MRGICEHVTHRIGGLERLDETLPLGNVVTHRIGGLEKSCVSQTAWVIVTHRIGGLEINSLP